MWMRSHEATLSGVSASEVWNVWANVNGWNRWQKDLESARLDGEFESGSTFRFKPKGGPSVKITILEAVKNRGFIDLTKFPLARMYGSHQFTEEDGLLKMKTSMSMEGPLTFLWRKLVGQEIVNKLPRQMEWLAQEIENVKQRESFQKRASQR